MTVILTPLKLVDKFTYLGSSVTSTEKDTDTRLTKAWTAINRLSIIWKSDLTDEMKRSFFQAAVTSILLYGCTTWTLTKRLEKKLDGNYTRMLRAILNKSWRQHPTRHQLYVLSSHLHVHAASQRHNNKDAWRKTQEQRTHEDFFTNIHLSLYCKGSKGLFKGFACERMLETEHNLHIFTPLLWPSRCVLLVLLDAQPEGLGSTPSGLFRGPPRSGVAFPTTSRL